VLIKIQNIADANMQGF